MNRRSLMLGSVIAVAAGALGAKAPEKVTFVEEWSPSGTRYSVMPEQNGYAARFASGDYPEWWTRGEDRLIKQHLEIQPMLTLKDLQDAADLLRPDVERNQRALREMQIDWDRMNSTEPTS